MTIPILNNVEVDKNNHFTANLEWKSFIKLPNKFNTIGYRELPVKISQVNSDGSVSGTILEDRTTNPVNRFGIKTKFGTKISEYKLN